MFHRPYRPSVPPIELLESRQLLSAAPLTSAAPSAGSASALVASGTTQSTATLRGRYLGTITQTGNPANQQAVTLTIDRQTGQAVSGSFVVAGGGAFTVSGKVGARKLRLNLSGSSGTGTIVGTTPDSGRSITGTITSAGVSGPIDLTKQLSIAAQRRRARKAGTPTGTTGVTTTTGVGLGPTNSNPGTTTTGTGVTGTAGGTAGTTTGTGGTIFGSTGGNVFGSTTGSVFSTTGTGLMATVGTIGTPGTLSTIGTPGTLSTIGAPGTLGATTTGVSAFPPGTGLQTGAGFGGGFVVSSNFNNTSPGGAGFAFGIGATGTGALASSNFGPGSTFTPITTPTSPFSVSAIPAQTASGFQPGPNGPVTI